MEGFLTWKIAPWKRVMITRCVALGPALAVAALADSSPDTSLIDDLMTWLNVLQSIQLPFALIPVLVLTSNEKLMGSSFVNGPWVKLICWILALIVMGTNIYLVIQITVLQPDGIPATVWFYVLESIFGVAYLGFIFILCKKNLEDFLAYIKCKAGMKKDEYYDPLLDNIQAGS